ncbi:hypothetical protein ACJMK2_025509 [Sinanodonta woodiana]|uniref:Solute carrier family 25 member 44 n=1 Tax=Sinanodonta woodiana TaxID=1069815 RepID=A0ABD3XGR6_SINWO
MDSLETEEIRVVEMYMMDKRKYYPLTMLSGFTIRGILYPFGLIKTRLQIQVGLEIYKGTFDAFVKISRNEGVRGLYRGFWVNCAQIFPSLAYITTYEKIRDYLRINTDLNTSQIKSFISGGLASIVGQTLTVPLDIVTQHIMLLGNQKHSSEANVQKKLKSLQRIHVPPEMRTRRFGTVHTVIQEVYRQDGILGFYKGYFVSLALFAPNSALWWMFYDTYSDKLQNVLPDWVPRLAIQCVSAPIAGVTAAVITNSLDVIRARIQVEGKNFNVTLERLWKEEGFSFAFKGLSARIVQSVVFSFFIMLGYESLKRWSLKDEYKGQVRW